MSRPPKDDGNVNGRGAPPVSDRQPSGRRRISQKNRFRAVLCLFLPQKSGSKTPRLVAILRSETCKIGILDESSSPCKSCIRSVPQVQL